MKIRMADLIAKTLKQNGIDDVFMLTGGGAMFLNDALGYSELKCHYLLHEQACAIAAEGYARVNQKPACVCVTTGPGGTNALTGVLGAYLDSIPMIVISGQVKYKNTVEYTGLPLRQFGDQEFDIVKCVSHMTKFSKMITGVNDCIYSVEKAISVSKSGRQGPCWIDIPQDIQNATVEENDVKHFEGKTESFDISDAQTEQVAELIKVSKRPLFYFGNGIRIANVKDAAVKLIEKFNVPAVLGFNCIDLLPCNHPLYAGRTGLVGDRAGNFAVQNSDLIIVLANRLNIRQIGNNYEKFAKKAKIVMVDIDESELNKPSLKIDYKICGDVKIFIEKLYKKTLKKDCGKWVNYCSENVKKYPTATENQYKETRKNRVSPYVLCAEFSKKLKDNACIIASNGTCCVAGTQALIVKKNTRYITNSGCAAMGYGLPAAIGACIAAGNKEVYCIEGDGSLQMNIQELQTIITKKLPLKIIYINNGGYHSIRQTQNNFFKRVEGIGEDSGDLSFPSISKIAKAYGIAYLKISKLAETDGRLNDFINFSGAVILEVMCDKDLYFQPKLLAKTLPDGRLESPELSDMFPFLSREEYEERMSISKD